MIFFLSGIFEFLEKIESRTLFSGEITLEIHFLEGKRRKLLSGPTVVLGYG